MPAMIDETGNRYGRLEVLRLAPAKEPGASWLCRCHGCGREVVIRGRSLRYDKPTSCVACGNTEHGISKSHPVEYQTWLDMIGRCHNPQFKNFKWYGARGITVCNRWRFGEGGKTGVECFVEDMGRRPKAKTSIDRIDDAKVYSKQTCRWASQQQQANNTRRNRRFMFRGVERTIPQIAELARVPADKLRYLVTKKGMSVADAVRELGGSLRGVRATREEALDFFQRALEGSAQRRARTRALIAATPPITVPALRPRRAPALLGRGVS